MTINCLYFASLREQLGVGEEQFELPNGVATVDALTQWLRQRGNQWSQQLAADKPLLVAVNQQMATPQQTIKDGDEVAWFPPVSGG